MKVSDLIAEDDDRSEQQIMEMTNLRSNETGIVKYVLWASPEEPSHSPRIKVTQGPRWSSSNVVIPLTNPGVIGNAFTIPSKEFNRIVEWINLNMEVLLKFWNREIEYTQDFHDQLKKLP